MEKAAGGSFKTYKRASATLYPKQGQLLPLSSSAREYDGGDDEHEKDSQPGWNTKTDELGG